MASSSHKPRAKAKRSKGDSDRSHLQRGQQASAPLDPATLPLAAFLWPAKGSTSQWLVLPLVLIAAGLFRWAVSLWPYSGYKTPPMHGDFEAQRHWMEITAHLPMIQWYFYDLEWWGLDYPPLTAYHSWALGKFGSFLNASWFALDTSRALDDDDLKVYMRATVLVSEYLVYMPSLVILVRRLVRTQGVQTWQGTLALVAILMQPATMLIDHGHFQYNTVMLGFFLACLSNVLAERYLWACVFFVAALGFKQMALYYAPAIGVILIAACFRPKVNIILLFGMAFVTTLSFAALFAPFILAGLWRGAVLDGKGRPLPLALSISPTIPYISLDASTWYYAPMQQLFQSIYRIFPFSRGIFEDKVANLWCALNVIVKLRQYPPLLLQRLSLVATLAAITPPCAILLMKPHNDAIPYGIAATAWGFFLCSFQVHEKSVLLPLLPMTLVLAHRAGFSVSIRAWIGWANILGAWTCFPLLKRDQLRVPYAVLTLVWAYLLALPPASFSAYLGRGASREDGLATTTKLVHLSFYALMAAWHVGEALVDPPAGKPDLWVVLNVELGAAGFGICYLWCVWRCLETSGLLETWRRTSWPSEKGKAKKT
ncbi:MAG: Glucosyltransferase-like protein [Piccolia ochrophora]|nr:MAG: Glucosyltransferase-like protein [Piccolia ochrophora]